MGDHRAGVSGTDATTLAEAPSATSPGPGDPSGRRAARHSQEQRTSPPYAGRRVAQVASPPKDEVSVTESLPYAGRRVAGRMPVTCTEPTPVAPVGRRIALDAELGGHASDAEDVVGHLLRPTAAPTLESYAGRRIARHAQPITELVTELITEPIVVKPVLITPVVEVADHTLVPEPVQLVTPVVDPPVIDAPVIDAPVVAESVLVEDLLAEAPAPVVLAAEELALDEPVVLDAAELVEPVLAVHPELIVETPPARTAAAKRTRPGGRRASSRRTRVPSLPLLAGVAVLAISAGGALQAVHPGLAGADANGRISPASALSGSSAVGSASLLGGRGTSVSRSSDRTDGSDSLQAAADAQAKERDAALSVYASQAQKRAAQIKLHQWVLPVAPGVYHLTARFGDYSSLWSHFHTGLDFAADTGTPIMAVAGGTITETGYSGAYGNRTIETLPDGTELWYCHQNEFGTAVGDVVKPGQVIGYVGSTGNVTGPHLHLEVHPGGGDPVDPYTALQVHGLNP